MVLYKTKVSGQQLLILVLLYFRWTRLGHKIKSNILEKKIFYTIDLKTGSIFFPKRMRDFNHSQNIHEKLWFSCEIAHYEKLSISVFQEIFTSADNIFISGGGLSTRQ